MGKIRRVINDKPHDLIKGQHAPTLFQPSTLKRCVAETGSESTRLEQRRGMLTFDKVMKFVVYYTANFPH